MARRPILKNITNLKAYNSQKQNISSLKNNNLEDNSSIEEVEEEIYGYKISEIDAEHVNLLKIIQIDDINTPTMHYFYQQDLLNDFYLREKKYLPNRKYLKHQTQINGSHRQKLIDWLVDINYKLNFSNETLFMCVNLIDRFLSKKCVSLAKFKLFGITSLFICSKYEEIHFPPIKNYLETLQLENVTADDIINSERYIIKVLDYDLMYVQPLAFLRYITKCNNYETRTRLLAKYFMEITLVHEEFIGVKGSAIAAAAFSLSCKILQKKSDLLKYFVKNKPEEVEKVTQLLLFVIINKDVTPCLKNKYTNVKAMDVSNFLNRYIQKYKERKDKVFNLDQ